MNHEIKLNKKWNVLNFKQMLDVINICMIFNH